MKLILVFIMVLLSSELMAQQNFRDRVRGKKREEINPILMPINIPKVQICTTPPPMIIPPFLMAETSCFQEVDLGKACGCLTHRSVTYMAGAEDILRARKVGNKGMQEAARLTAMKKLHDAAGVGVMQVLVTNTKTETDDEELKKVTEEVEIAKSRNFAQRTKDFVIGRGKNKQIENISNDYIKYMDQYEECVSFTDFSLINNIPKKDFISALNDPQLTIEDFTQSTASTNDPVTKKRREAIKDFLLFNLDWQSAFTSGDENEAFASVLNIYKNIKPETFYKAATDPKEKAVVLNRLDQDKKQFFKKQKFAKMIRKNKEKKESDYEESVEVILKNAELISSSPELLDKSLHFQGLPTRQQCKDGLAEVSDCQTIYVNYCNMKKDGDSLTDKERMKIENAFETIDDNAVLSEHL